MARIPELFYRELQKLSWKEKKMSEEKINMDGKFYIVMPRTDVENYKILSSKEDADELAKEVLEQKNRRVYVLAPIKYFQHPIEEKAIEEKQV